MSQEEEEKETQIDIVGDGSLLDFLLTEFGITNLGEINEWDFVANENNKVGFCRK